MIRKFVYIFLFTEIFCTGQAQPGIQDSIYQNNDLVFRRALSVAGISAIYLGTLYDSYKTWWEDSKRPFTFSHSDWFDPKGDNGIDKLGHFFTSMVFYKIQRNLFLWGGFDTGEARIYSGSLTLLMALIIEAGDGFSRYGFDYKDFSFNLGGLTYGILQDEVPFLNNINMKWSYFPSTGISFPPKFSEHYEGHIYWMTFNIAGMINYFTGSYIFEYLQPAVGYSINQELKSEFIIGLDINLLPLFSKENSISKYLGDVINLVHIPAPGVKFTEGEATEYKLFLLR